MRRPARGRSPAFTSHGARARPALRGAGRRRAFTLIEVVAALALAAMLLGALVSVLVIGARQKRQADSRRRHRPAVTLLSEQLRRDVINARFVQSGPGTLRLVGPVARDRASRTATGRLAEVVYRVSAWGSAPWLVRQQRSLDEAGSGLADEEPLWAGATAIELVPLEESLRSGGAQGAPPGMRPLPQRLRLIVHRAGARPLVDLQIRHHWEEP